MLHRYVAVIAMFLMAPLAAQQLNQANKGNRAQEGAQQQANVQAAESQASAALSIDNSLKRIAAAQETPGTCAKPGDENTRECQDLKAQKDMVFWAKWMLVTTIVGGIVSGVATLLIFKTFQQTRHATYAARRSAIYARQAVKTSRQSAEKQLRAYVGPEDWQSQTIDTQRDARIIEIAIGYKNFGQTPAYALGTTDADFAIVDDAGHVYRHAVIERGGRNAVLQPSQSLSMQFLVSIFEEEVGSIYVGERIISLKFSFLYRDSFDQNRTTTVHLQCVGDLTNPRWAYAPTGNTAT